MDTAVPGVRGSPAAVDAARCVRLRGGASVSPVLSESSETLSESRAADDARLVDRAGGARASFSAASDYPDFDDEDKDADRLCVAVEVAFRNETSDRSSDDAESDDEDDARDDGGAVALGGARRRVLGGGGGGGGINRCDG